MVKDSLEKGIQTITDPDVLVKIAKIDAEREELFSGAKNLYQERTNLILSNTPKSEGEYFFDGLDYELLKKVEARYSEQESPKRKFVLMLDHLTPVFRSKLEDMPQKTALLLDACLREGVDISQSHLAEVVNAGGQNVIAQAFQWLIKNDVVEVSEIKGKQKLYRVKNRTFVAWYNHRDIYLNLPEQWEEKFLTSEYMQIGQLN